MKCFCVAGLLAMALFFSVSLAGDQELKVLGFSDAAQRGVTLYMGRCASCHGPTLLGTEKSSPLLHKYYEPNHHSDEAFYAAVKLGWRRHYLGFGNMPADKDTTDGKIAFIIRFVSEMQQAKGVLWNIARETRTRIGSRRLHPKDITIIV